MRTQIGRGLLARAMATILVAAIPAAASNTTPKPLEERVRHELAMLPYFTMFDQLSFRLDNSRVILLGEVTQPFLKSAAESAVREVAGVTDVENDLEVLPLSPMDNRLRMQLARAIYGYAPLQHYGLGLAKPIRIIVRNGNVTLTGEVLSETDRSLTYIRANGVPGIFSVTNELRVDK